MTAGFLSGLLGGYDRSRRRSEQRRREHVTATLPARTQKVHASGSARPSVSVILPFLNEERFLAGAVASVLAQTDAAWELLLVDDGSTDSSAATADELAAEDPGRIRVLRHPSGENRGLPASRNLGLSEAESSLVAFIDADDRWEPFKLAEQAALFRRDPELTMVCGPTLYRPIGEGEPSTLTPVLVDAPRRLGTGEFAAEMVRGNVTPPPPSNVMFRTTALRQAGGVPAGDSLYEDQRTFVAVSLIGPVLVSDRAWSSYTVRPDSLYGSLADDWVTRLRQQRDFHRWILRWAPRRGPAGRSLGALLVRRRLCGAVRRRVVDGADAAAGVAVPTIVTVTARAARASRSLDAGNVPRRIETQMASWPVVLAVNGEQHGILVVVERVVRRSEPHARCVFARREDRRERATHPVSPRFVETGERSVAQRLVDQIGAAARGDQNRHVERDRLVDDEVDLDRQRCPWVENRLRVTVLIDHRESHDLRACVGANLERRSSTRLTR